MGWSRKGNYFYFYFNSFISFLETNLFIWYIPLVPGVPILYPQYHLILCIADFHTRETGN